MPENSLIVISQFPVIEEQLKALRDRWEAKAKEAASMVCTEETVQALKSIRAEMRKEFDEADRQRKAVKARYMEPWDKIEATFKECVKDSFTRADASLKASIAGYEDEIKARCEADLRAYFAELLTAERFDFLTFEDAMKLGGLRINLSDAKKVTPRQLQEGLALVVSKVALGIDQIAQMDDAPEIMAEYKTCFDVGKAVATVQKRKRDIAAEQEAAAARQAAQSVYAEAVAKVDAVAPPVTLEPAREPETLYTITFTIKDVTRAQALRVRDYLKQEGIDYE